MIYLFLALFVTASVLHLYASFVDNQKFRAATKGFILLFLLLYYIFSAEKKNGVLIAALITSLLGDILLIPKGTGWFVSGGLSFMASHFCFIAVYLLQMDFSAVNPVSAVIAGIVYVSIVLIEFKFLRPHIKKALGWAMTFYLICNGAMNVFAFMLLWSNPCLATVLAYIGAISFFASDSLLFFNDFYPKPLWRKHFPIMLTYIIAEFLITQGMLLLAR